MTKEETLMVNQQKKKRERYSVLLVAKEMQIKTFHIYMTNAFLGKFARTGKNLEKQVLNMLRYETATLEEKFGKLQ